MGVDLSCSKARGVSRHFGPVLLVLGNESSGSTEVGGQLVIASLVGVEVGQGGVSTGGVEPGLVTLGDHCVDKGHHGLSIRGTGLANKIAVVGNGGGQTRGIGRDRLARPVGLDEGFSSSKSGIISLHTRLVGSPKNVVGKMFEIKMLEAAWSCLFCS